MKPLYLLIALQAADAASTLYGFKVGLTEANPLLRKLGEKIGKHTAIIVAKLAAVAAFLGMYAQGWLDGQDWVLWAICAGYVGLVAHNVALIRKHS